MGAGKNKGDHVEFTGEFVGINDAEMSGGSTSHGQWSNSTRSPDLWYRGKTC